MIVVCVVEDGRVNRERGGGERVPVLARSRRAERAMSRRVTGMT